MATFGSPRRTRSGASPPRVITEYSAPAPGEGLKGITAGPNGNLWFTEFYGNKIGRITTGRVITEYPIPTVPGQPWAITAGPDERVWFTEYYGEKIGALRPSAASPSIPPHA